MAASLRQVAFDQGAASLAGESFTHTDVAPHADVDVGIGAMQLSRARFNSGVGAFIAASFLATGCDVRPSITADAPRSVPAEVVLTQNWLFKPEIIPPTFSLEGKTPASSAAVQGEPGTTVDTAAEQMSAPKTVASDDIGVLRVRGRHNIGSNNKISDRDVLGFDASREVRWTAESPNPKSVELVADIATLDHHNDFVAVVYDDKGVRYQLKPIAKDDVSALFILDDLPTVDGTDTGKRVHIAKIGVEQTPPDKATVSRQALSVSASREMPVLPLPVDGQNYAWQLRGVTFSDSNLKTLSPDDVKGKIVVFDHWYSYCAPCVASLKGIRELAARHPKDLVVISISYDEESGTPHLEKVLSKVGSAPNWHHARIIGGTELAALTAQSLTGSSRLTFPLIVALDTEGNVMFHGPMGAEKLTQLVEEELDPTTALGMKR